MPLRAFRPLRPAFGCPRTLAAGVALALLAGRAGAAQPVTTEHTMQLAGRTLAYSAEAGFMPMTAPSSKDVHGDMFYVSYHLQGKAAAHRPIAFIWNGGPGGPATWIEYQAFGPRLLEGEAFSDNQATLLPTTDMVYLDPIGTGYSRPRSPEFAKEYFSTVGDTAATVQFIESWIAQHHAEGRPIYLIGESYGTFRAAGAAELLEEHHHKVAGVVLISGGSGSGPLITGVVRAALVVPQRAAAALTWAKTAPDLGGDRTDVVRKATQWALESYLPALRRVSTLSDAEREAIAGDLSRFIGYPLDKIDRKTLVVGANDYAQTLPGEPGKKLVSYDMRITEMPPLDLASIEHYLRQDLGVKTDLEYWNEGAPDDPSHAAGSRWVYNWRWYDFPVLPAGQRGGTGLIPEPWLPKAIAIDPDLKIWIAGGQYDSLNSCAENDVLRAALEPDLAGNYTTRCYDGGHMMYRDPAVRAKLSNDLKGFIVFRSLEPIS